MSGFFNSLKSLASGAANAASAAAKCQEQEGEDTRMRFSVVPQPGESGFTQWLDAMKMVARLPGGIPPEFRKRLWLTLAERHLEQRRVDWKQAEKLCFNEWSNPDDEELGIQIVKDLHRTGCSLFCGTAGRDNQAVLRRVLLGFARWNKSVGYCQGLNVLAALVLQVMDRAEAASVKVMIYLIEGVLPEGYFADNLRGLSVDMAVFRDLLRMRLPRLSRHLEALQSDAKDKATGSSYEPPLTNVFTMQWFLTLFCHCLPQEAVLRVWDLIFLEGDEVLLRTALAIWEGLAERIMTVTSADEFYSIMGVLTREMLEFTDTNNLIKAIVSTGPLSGVTNLREKHRYNITPWARRLSDDEDDDTDEDEKLAVAAAVFGMSQRIKKDRGPTSLGSLQTIASSSDRDKLALDINTLKQQYAKLRERQRQAHIILSAACARQSMVPPPTSQAMNHLLVGKSALVSSKGRQLGPPPGAVPPKIRSSTFRGAKNQNRKDKQDITLHWKDAKGSWKDVRKRKENEKDTAVTNERKVRETALVTTPEEMSVNLSSPKRDNVDSNNDSDSDSTSTELCDEPDRLSDVDSEEPTSTSDCYVMATDDEKSPGDGNSPNSGHAKLRPTRSVEMPKVTRESKTTKKNERTEEASELEETSIAKITDQIRRLSADDEIYVETTQVDNKKMNDPTAFQTSRDRRTDDKSLDDSARLKRSTSEIATVREKEKFVGKTSLDNLNFLIRDVSVGDVNVSTEQKDLDEVSSCNENTSTDDRASVVLDVTKDDSKICVGVPDVSGKIDFHSDLETDIDILKNECELSDEFIRSSIELNFDKTLVALDSKVQRFETLVGFNSAVRRSESTGENLDTTSAKATLYPVSYVIGYLPISPITVDQKLSKMVGMSAPVDGVKISTRDTVEDNITKSIDNGTSSDSTDDDKASAEIAHFDKHKMQSPKTPDSAKSIGSGETMGPDSKQSSLTVSPRTPVRSESRDLRLERSVCTSASSDSKTLTFRSFDSDDAQARSDPKKTSLDRSSPSTPVSTDSAKNKSDISPKPVASSSSDSSSLDRKKSSDKSFSSDLQSPISANSIKYTVNYIGGQDNLSESPIDLISATSPFYPIVHPNQKTPSPYGINVQKNSTDVSPDQKSTNLQVAHRSKNTCPRINESSDAEATSKESDVYDGTRSRKDDYLTSRTTRSDDNSIGPELEYDSRVYRRKTRKFLEDDRSTSRKTSNERMVLANEDKRKELADEERKDQLYRSKDCVKPFERSCSSLDKRFADLRPSASSDEFVASNAKKRSSDILEDLRHLEAKASGDGTSDNGVLSKKTSYILEDLKSLEARRQDTFSDSANGFSKCRFDDLNASGSGDTRKSYVVEPKIRIEEDSDSILKSLTRRTRDNDLDDDKESKFGVWTKVKPRKKNGSGRRSSERALKIIQENSAILHKILTCQAKKRLPDLEEISKEITISPINEEISKIFSPILEKIGLNEHEINEELARINFKDFDQTTTTSGSEFDAKINDELSRLSLIDDTEDADSLNVDEILSRDYLDTREALIDRQINEELSKLLANYEERSSSTIVCRDKGSSSQNTSELEGLDLTSISTNVFSHKSSNDSIETKSELGSIQESAAKSEQFCHYAENVLPYAPPKYNLQDISPKSDIDIYRELEKLDKISSRQILLTSPEAAPVAAKVPSPTSYQSNSFPYSNARSPILEYPTSKPEFETSPLKSPYDDYKAYDYRSRISPRKIPSNPYSVRSYDKPSVDLSFEFVDQKSTSSPLIYDLTSKKRPALSKETLEFRVRYDDEPLQSVRSEDLTLRPFQTNLVDLNKGASYYDNKSSALPKYVSTNESNPDTIAAFPLEYRYEGADIYRRKYEATSPTNYERRPPCQLTATKPETEFGSYLTTPRRRRESHSLSPSHQFIERKFGIPMNPYVAKLSPSLEDVTRRPVSHPEFPDKMSVSKYSDLPSQGSNSYRKSSLSLGNIGHVSRAIGRDFDATPSPKTQFSPFPVRGTARKPKELGLKLGLYSPTSSGIGQSKRS